MVEEDSIKYNREILSKKIEYRIVIFGILLIIVLILINTFTNCNKLKDILLGSILSLLVTIIYSLVDLYIKVFEDIDKERTKFIKILHKIHSDFNIYIGKELQAIMKDNNIICESDINKYLDKLMENKNCNEEIYAYIEKLWYFVYVESKNIYTIYSQTIEYNEIEKYIVKVYIWFESHKLLNYENEVGKIDQKRFLLVENGVSDEFNIAIDKARRIIDKRFEDIDVNELPYFVLNREKGNVLKTLKLCISNILDNITEEMQIMSIEQHKSETSNIFLRSMINAIKSNGCIYIFAMLLIIAMYFM